MERIVLHGYWRSSSTHRVRLALGFKGLAFTTVTVDLRAGEQHDGKTVHPMHHVPVLEIGTRKVIESVAIIELLEQLYPAPPLYPTDPWKRARVREGVEMIDAGMQPLQNLAVLEKVSSDDAERTSWARHFNERGLRGLEEWMKDSDGPFVASSVFTAADVFLIPQVASAVRFGVDMKRFPRIRSAFDAASRLPFVRAADPNIAPGAPGLSFDMKPEVRDRHLARVVEVLGPIAGKMRLLESIAWPRSVEEEFFDAKAKKLPKVSYSVDRDKANDSMTAIRGLMTELEGDHVLLRWLRSQCESFVDALTMQLSAGTKQFYETSVRLYGGAKTTAFDRDTTNLDLADHIAARIPENPVDVNPNELGAEDLAAFVAERLAERQPKMSMEIIIDPNLSAKVICGRTTLRVRKGARFSRPEADGLYLHEVETHALTAQNGASQKAFPLLKSGGPRTTRSQEGLAVFSELYGHALSTPRLRRLAQRVRLVGMAEDGASFLDLYRHLVDSGLPERESYLDVQRICRGGLIEGGGPFTKDACYLAGLMDVYNVLRAALTLKAPVIGEHIVSGRIVLPMDKEDNMALLWLRAQGVLTPPPFLPAWIHEWDSLLSYFAFTSFLNEVDFTPPAFPAPVLELVRDAQKASDNARDKGSNE